jgi:D-glycero-D-manno-heptose 1,7-bisphosphate phosphatase
MKTPALFLDRDGTINEEVDFLTNPDHLHLLPGAANALREAIKAGFKIFIITNQSGIARGLLSEERLRDIHSSLIRQLKSEQVTIDGIYYCPHHPEFGEPPYRKECNCRKPRPGMIEEAAQSFDLDLVRSFVIGDRLIDIQTGNTIGIPSILVLTGYGKEELELCRKERVPISYVAQDLSDAVRYIQTSIHFHQPTHCS